MAWTTHRYRIRAEQHGAWWILESPDLLGFCTQVRRLREFEDVARCAIADILQIDAWNVDVILDHVLIEDPRLQQSVDEARRVRATAEVAVVEVAETMAELAARLVAVGVDPRDATTVLSGRFQLAGLAEALRFDEERAYDHYAFVDPWERPTRSRYWREKPDPMRVAAARLALANLVGGLRALDALHAAPLIDEGFVWDGIPADIRKVVAEAVHLGDAAAEALFDTEFRTAFRRVLAQVALHGPDAFRRSDRADTAAAGVCWLVATANRLFVRAPREGVRGKDLAAVFGLSNAGGRAHSLLIAGGFGQGEYRRGTALGSPAYLVSSFRADVIARRDELALKLPPLPQLSIVAGC